MRGIPHDSEVRGFQADSCALDGENSQCESRSGSAAGGAFGKEGLIESLMCLSIIRGNQDINLS